MEIKYFSKTMALTIFPTLIQIRQSWQKYHSFLKKKNKKRISEIKLSLSEDEFNFKLLRNEINCIYERINDRENERNSGDSDVVLFD